MRLLLALLFWIRGSLAYKILIYNSKFAHSHSNFLGSVADILVEAGHNVTSLIPVIDIHGKDGTSKSNKIYLDMGEEIQQAHHDSIGEHKMFFYTPYYDPIGTYMGGQAMADMFKAACIETLKNDELIERLREEKYDVMMAESFDMCGIGSYSRSFDVHSTFDRMKNLVGEFLVRSFFGPGRWKLEPLFHEKYADFPGFKELSSNVAYVFANNEPLMDFGGPTMSRVIPIGGLGAKQPKKLDEYWEGVMTTRSKVVIISFGSVAPSSELEDDKKQALLKAMAAFPDITFIWKYEMPEDEFATAAKKNHPNLILSKWTPQNDLLNHPNIAAFISHGGMGTCMEVAQRAVPAIFFPLFGDQPKNAWAMEYNGVGKVISKFELSNADKIITSLREIIENKKYRENAKILSKKLANKPFSSRDLVIKYTEFAAEFGPSKALRPQSCDMSFIEYHNLDIIAIALFVTLITLIIVAHIAIKIVKRVFRKSSTKQKRS
ncbi:hypothetical protein PRIPAC_97727 [Pristionchus pacificus]|uniref:glucuronosyltransferase n=1 Tax=Pristionchus pacificus TaxID=54126 RepID=A0A2A6BIV4_PRIPA|nr:hypothetical protein PRIPAC_97727 [Pristionchus pacificus]|eukprot:PDM65832.1 Glycosyltransferase [Pristionchus pacificus]